ncbi:MAG: hypothetical protein K0R62_3682 [Nonomuraea muscovyensis]|nr:hypothetical protein [Nonomuraea muscovyensis]
MPWASVMSFWPIMASHGLAVPPVTLTRSRPESTAIEVLAEFHQGAVPLAKVPLTTSSGAAAAVPAADTGRTDTDKAVRAEAVIAVRRVNSRTKRVPSWAVRSRSLIKYHRDGNGLCRFGGICRGN